MKKITNFVFFLMFILLTFSVLSSTNFTLAKSKKIALNKKTISMKEKQKYTLKLKGANKKKIKWSSSNNAIASVKYGVVSANKAGKCKITAKYIKKKYKCTVKIKKRSMDKMNSGDNTPITKPTSPVNTGQISLSIKNNDTENKTLMLSVFNGTNTDISVGYGRYSLKKLVNGIWEDIPHLENAPVVPDIAFVIKPNGDWSESFSLKDNFGILTSGDYMISKKINNVVCNAGFIIPEPTPPVSNEQITLWIKNNDTENKTLMLTVFNGTSTDISIGYGRYALKKLENGIWEDVPILENAPVVPDMAFVIKPNGDWSESFSLKDNFGILTSGNYMISKKINNAICNASFIIP